MTFSFNIKANFNAVNKIISLTKKFVWRYQNKIITDDPGKIEMHQHIFLLFKKIFQTYIEGHLEQIPLF